MQRNFENKKKIQEIGGFMDRMPIDKFKDTLAKYQKLFALENWTFTVKENSFSPGDYNAKTLADPRYHHADITISASLNPEDHERIVIHELIHVVMALYDFYVDSIGQPEAKELYFTSRESAVSQLTAIIMRVMKEGVNYA